jgi:hypothetical protein
MQVCRNGAAGTMRDAGMRDAGTAMPRQHLAIFLAVYSAIHDGLSRPGGAGNPRAPRILPRLREGSAVGPQAGNARNQGSAICVQRGVISLGIELASSRRYIEAGRCLCR